MRVHLLTHNPERWVWDGYDEDVKRVRAGLPVLERWSVAQRVHGIAEGDWVFLLRQGRARRGIIGAGRAASEPYTDAHWDDGGGTAQYIRVDWLDLLPLEEVVPVELLEREVPGFRWGQVYSSGRTMPEPAGNALMSLWERRLGTDAAGVMSDPVYEEGAPVTLASRRYERSRAVRMACIDAHGYDCSVCGVNFEDLYGDIGRHYVQVHHVVPLHVAAGSHTVDPARDLRPVCANCHVMLHRSVTADGARILTPDEMAAHLRR